MSPAVDNFVHSLVEMSKAFEELPSVREQLAKAEESNLRLSQTIGDREMSILALKDDIEMLHAKLRKAEEDRDEAERMFLECDDKLAAFRRLVESFGNDSRSLIAAQQPAPAVPTPVAVPSEEPVPAGVTTVDEPFPWNKSVDHGFSSPALQANPTPGQSVSGPTVSTSDTPTDVPLAPVPSGDAGSTGPVTEGVSVPSGEDVGYHNEPSPKYSEEWYRWASKMDTKHHYAWPDRAA